MLTDILGIILAFCSVMLLFSMIVTMLVQAIQASFDLRYHNLKRGVLKLSEHVEDVEKHNLNQGLNKFLYFGGMSQGEILPSIFSKLFAVRKTEISEEELLLLIRKQVPDLSNQTSDDISFAFKNLEQYMSKLFQRTMHILSILMGLLIAFIFQLNSFELLTQLSTDKNIRTAYIEMLDENNKTNFDVQHMNKDILKEMVILKLSEKYPEATLGDILVSGYTLIELKEIIRERVKSKKVGSDFEEVLAQYQRQNKQMAVDELKRIASLSAQYHFEIKSDISVYYWQSQAWLLNIFGTLVSGILISLGAPFWFNAIKNITSLKDKSVRKVSV